jgi:hypothetical protein
MPVGDEEKKETEEGEPAFNVESDHEARRTADDEAADKVETFWRPRLEHDPQGALDDLNAKVKELGYELGYAGRGYMKPVAKRTYHISDPEERKPLDVFDDGNVDLTLLDVCLWSELAFKKWQSL